MAQEGNKPKRRGAERSAQGEGEVNNSQGDAEKMSGYE